MNKLARFRFFSDVNKNQIPDGLDRLQTVAQFLKVTLLPTLRDVATATTATVVAFVAVGDELRKLFDAQMV